MKPKLPSILPAAGSVRSSDSVSVLICSRLEEIANQVHARLSKQWSFSWLVLTCVLVFVCIQQRKINCLVLYLKVFGDIQERVEELSLVKEIEENVLKELTHCEERELLEICKGHQVLIERKEKL